MQQLYADLWQTRVENPFSDVMTHAYIILHTEGNILVYNTSHPDDIHAMEALGGLRLHCLSHRHEAGDSLQIINEKYHPQLCIDRLEASYITQRNVTVELTETTTLAKGFRAIPTPGHTSGGFSYVYSSPTGLTYLFTGDTFFQSHSRWSTFILTDQGGNAAHLAESLMTLRALQPGVVLCSAFVGDTSVVELTDEQWIQAIDTNLQQLKEQENQTET